MHDHVEELSDGSISDGLSELGLSESGNATVSVVQGSNLDKLT